MTGTDKKIFIKALFVRAESLMQLSFLQQVDSQIDK